MEHTFCWEDENIDAMHFMLLLDSQGEEVLRVDVNGDCVTDTIEPGDYVRVYDLITPTLSELDKRAAVHVGIIENEIHLGNYCAFSHMLFLSKVKLNYVLL